MLIEINGNSGIFQYCVFGNTNSLLFKKTDYLLNINNECIEYFIYIMYFFIRYFLISLIIENLIKCKTLLPLYSLMYMYIEMYIFLFKYQNLCHGININLDKKLR